MNISKIRIGTGVASLALLGAALVPTIASVQPAAAASSSETAASPATEEGPRHLRARLGEDLAAALGIPVDDLRAAMEKVRESLQPTERPATPPTEEERAARRTAFNAALASELGISVDQLEAAQETVKAQHIADAIERIEAKVADGSLTRAEADAMIAALESGERPLLGGEHHGFGGPRLGGLGAR